MFGFNNEAKKKREEREARKERNALKAQQLRYEKYWEWRNSEEYKRMNHLKTLIITAYETVNIKINDGYNQIDESFTRADYLEDFKVFFKPEVFDKLKGWCEEYITLCKKEDESKFMG